MDVDDKELFSSAMADEPIPDVATEAPEAPTQEQPQQDGRARDEHGRFAARQAEQTPQPTTETPHQAAERTDNDRGIPSWRLKEMREERNTFQQQLFETQRQLEMLQRQNQPKPEPVPAPDMFENPPGFVDHYLKQGISPLEQQQQQLRAELQEQREYYSRRDAERDHGPEAVRAAYNWIAERVQQRDPDALHIYHQVMQSKHPFDAIVAAHKRTSVMQQIGNDPDAWAIQRARELAASDTKYRDALYSQPAQSNGRQQPGNPQGSIVKLPPSMSRLPNAQVSGDDDNDVSDAALFRHAMR